MEEQDRKQTALDELRLLLAREPASGRELVMGCRAIIRLWIDADLPYPHDLLDRIVGIESQTDHVLGGVRWPVLGRPHRLILDQDVEEQELREIHAFFAQHYEAATAALSQHLDASRGARCQTPPR